MSQKYDNIKLVELKENQNPETTIYEAIQNSDIIVLNKLLNEKYNEVILYEDDSQMSSRNKLLIYFIFI
jgi:hypothetical protein